MANAPLWTAQELQAATNGTLLGEVTLPINGVSIDTRTISPGDIFVAIKGGVHDGHDFVAKALQVGAGVGLVSRISDEMKAAGALLVVADDPLRGLENIGRASRARSLAQIIAVTGSVGKTSTKEMLRVALGVSGATHASDASFNNHWGVPLTLARMPRETSYGVFEIGMNHVGEITPLVGMVRPHIAIVTSIAASHLGNFSSLDEIAEAKAEIFSGVVPGGAAIINRDTPYFDMLKAAALKAGCKTIVGFGHHAEADVRLVRVALHDECCCITADVLGEHVIYKLGLPGEHMAVNSLAVMAAVKLAGADLARAALALATAAPPKGRGVQERLVMPNGEILLIDESYNANPASMAAALALLGNAKLKKGGRRIAVLGDMLELGQFSAALHAELSIPIDANKIDVLYASGPEMAHLWTNTGEHMRGAYATSAKDLVAVLLRDLKAGDVVMIKGSRGSLMAPLVEALRSHFPAYKKDV
jgi:UDP-N-acetylmuramoyl-tripeptide--D-alanyl-D-alanine ligase